MRTHTYGILTLLLIGLLLGACSDAVPQGSAGIKGPAKWAMLRKCKLPDPVFDDGDPVSRADYDVRVRLCASKRGDQVDALQRWARLVAKKS